LSVAATDLLLTGDLQVISIRIIIEDSIDNFVMICFIGEYFKSINHKGMQRLHKGTQKLADG
jgi:hypothetical protein